MLAIEIKNVWKKYKIGKPKKLSEAIPSFFSNNKLKEFWALRNINLNVKKAETLGIIGLNGSGKSTLLKILAGITFPTKGSTIINGRISSLLELGTGFHSDLSGAENIYLNGSLIGLSRKEIDKKFDDIVAFAEIDKFINTPVKYYSSGMYVRLGFAIAINFEPDILLVDEALSVGDAHFQNKSFSAFQDFKKRGCTLVIVTHDMSTVQTLCDRVVILEKGKLAKVGKPSKIVNKYLGHIAVKEDKNFKYSEGKRITNYKAEIEKIWIEDSNNKMSKIISGPYFFVNFRIKFNSGVKEPAPGVIIRNRMGAQISASNTLWAGIKTGNYQSGDVKVFKFKFPNIFEVGFYTISLNVLSSDLREIYDWRNDIAEVFFPKKFRTGSIVNPEYEIYF